MFPGGNSTPLNRQPIVGAVAGKCSRSVKRREYRQLFRTRSSIPVTSAAQRSSCSKALAMRAISARLQPTSSATACHVWVTSATSRIVARACFSDKPKNSAAFSRRPAEHIPSSRSMLVVKMRALTSNRRARAPGIRLLRSSGIAARLGAFHQLRPADSLVHRACGHAFLVKGFDDDRRL
jgi:hypothetical protein